MFHTSPIPKGKRDTAPTLPDSIYTHHFSSSKKWSKRKENLDQGLISFALGEEQARASGAESIAEQFMLRWELRHFNAGQFQDTADKYGHQSGGLESFLCPLMQSAQACEPSRPLHNMQLIMEPILNVKGEVGVRCRCPSPLVARRASLTTGSMSQCWVSPSLFCPDRSVISLPTLSGLLLLH
ncbi:hypothetical protein EVAR_93529_1 [Eumeta japonica]|uniref:Uncharacterized protein n=1 Tax=Eumeta variegata TaxID=151549 RepID=A0A4C1UR11_EUMVA|nr:hypothetical protein EVAR_93529_1 [Eumeta japonica]